MEVERLARKSLSEVIPMIIISPYSKKLERENPKSPSASYWRELISRIDEPIIQIGIDGEEQLVSDFRKNLPILELKALLKECRTWIGCDSFFQHLAWLEGKPGIVLWSVSDPLIFGHLENINLLKNKDVLVDNQFLWWCFVEHKDERFVTPDVVLEHIK